MTTATVVEVQVETRYDGNHRVRYTDLDEIRSWPDNPRPVRDCCLTAMVGDHLLYFADHETRVNVITCGDKWISPCDLRDFIAIAVRMAAGEDFGSIWSEY
jgi:hypothetical protein